MIDPCDRDAPEEYSLSTNPNPVNAEIPHRHPSQRTLGVQGLFSAVSPIAVSSRSRRPRVSSIVS